MSATLFSASYAGVSGLDLESELKQMRAADHDAIDASGTPDTAHARDEARIVGATPALLRETPRAGDYAVELHGVGKRYGERKVLSDFSLSIERGSFVAIVGRSGCGKSTLLRLVAELEAPSAGVLKKHDADGAPLDTRIMFQDARLLPWKTVLQNVMLGLGRGAREDARAVLAEVGLAGRADDWPAQLSGGQRQRVALARALVHRPQLLLLDEPLGALDALTRIEMHALIERLWREHRFTALLVTHDVHEAVALGDRILLIEEGRIALDQPVPLARPRVRASSAFAALEEHVLDRVLKSTPDDNAPLFHSSFHDAHSDAVSAASIHSTRPTDVRWAI
ncbi:ATP-binding cassette domain-containing protein [Paraburkholderia sartisoli]|uniref:Sulfonate transport system ATP-binding protein n=1 Tax=Paraburkholderia sartisoli TaxID=83784 RepID=A0A1H4EBE0_9BURK|nr:ATP-binding cassette domain-containing protein [Paraburkholderia sartisoli]SEA82119.1 sulfonate transport system ATP-binding protein [Paraburkholderia sartisoli]